MDKEYKILDGFKLLSEEDQERYLVLTGHLFNEERPINVNILVEFWARGDPGMPPDMACEMEFVIESHTVRHRIGRWVFLLDWNGDEKNLEEAWESIIKEEIPKRMGSREELFKDAFKRFLDEGCCHYAPKVFTDMRVKANG